MDKLGCSSFFIFGKVFEETNLMGYKKRIENSYEVI